MLLICRRKAEMRRVAGAKSRPWSAPGILSLCIVGVVLMGGRGGGPRGGGKPAGGPPPGVNSTINDFFLPGTQPDSTGGVLFPVQDSINCIFCHAEFPSVGLSQDAEPYFNWAGTMMANSARDPIFWACLTIANQDAPESADLCLRCHTPGAWLAGRSTPTTATNIGGNGQNPEDFDGVTCNLCHRMVDPMFEAGVSPPEDAFILDTLEDDPVFGNLVPQQFHTANYVFDPEDVRRGPFNLLDDFPFHMWAKSPFHQESDMCGTCHDVSNPLFVKSGDFYVPAADNMEHPTQDKFDMFPLERTFSEWEQSQFASGGVPRAGGFANFGGGLPPGSLLESCQDCHMPDVDIASPGCRVGFSNDHPDMPQHSFNGGNTWVMRAAKFLYEDGDTGLNDPVFNDQYVNINLTDDMIDASIARALDMLRNAADVTLTTAGSMLTVRVTNYSGHKLPTGYGEGRRMWINVKFFNDSEQLIEEHGEYGFGPGGNAVLSTGDTKVYEIKHGLDATMASLTGKPQGESFHFVLNNKVIKDNRIPPIGFNNANFAAVQSGPVAYAYANGQHWDDTNYAIPGDAARAVVTLYYQTTSKEYIEFLRDENTTDNRGQIAFNMWANPAIGAKSAPVDVDSQEIILGAACYGDMVTSATFRPPPDGLVNAADLAFLLGEWGPNAGSPADYVTSATFQPPADGIVDAADLAVLLGNWGLCE
jgi:hypothetical protein